MTQHSISDRRAQILLVEDNPSDVLLTKRALSKAKLLNNLSVVSDGVEALDFLNRTEKYSDSPEPDLILLDLNMPRKDGREVLEEIKNDERLAHIPVVVLTTSESEQDVLKSYKLHANCYITKPLDFEKFSKVVQQLENFWFSVVRLPNAE